MFSNEQLVSLVHTQLLNFHPAGYENDLSLVFFIKKTKGFHPRFTRRPFHEYEEIYSCLFQKISNKHFDKKHYSHKSFSILKLEKILLLSLHICF